MEVMFRIFKVFDLKNFSFLFLVVLFGGKFGVDGIISKVFV